MTSVTSNQRISKATNGGHGLPPSYLTKNTKEVSLIRLRTDLQVSVPAGNGGGASAGPDLPIITDGLCTCSFEAFWSMLATFECVPYPFLILLMQAQDAFIFCV